MYGIIAAMQEEMQEIKKMMTEIKEKQIYGLSFFEGRINNAKIVLVEAGVGGMFSEGVDLPGKRLIGAVIVGVGFPNISHFNSPSLQIIFLTSRSDTV